MRKFEVSSADLTITNNNFMHPVFSSFQGNPGNPGVQGITGKPGKPGDTGNPVRITKNQIHASGDNLILSRS